MKRINPAIAELNADRAINLVAAANKVSREMLLSRDRDHFTASLRALAMTLCYRGGMTQRRVAEIFKCSTTRTHKAIARTDSRCVMDPEFGAKFGNAVRDLGLV